MIRKILPIICAMMFFTIIFTSFVKIAEADDITDVEVTVGAVNAVLHFNVTANSDETYIRYNINGDATTKDTYTDPDDINFCDREDWLGTSNTERWMIIRGLEPDTTYNYTIYLNDVSDASGQFTTEARFTVDTGWQDEIFDDYLWEANGSIAIYQAVGEKYPGGGDYISTGNLNDSCRFMQAFYEDGKYYLLEDNFYMINSTDPYDFSGTWSVNLFHNFDSGPTVPSISWHPILEEYILECTIGSTGGMQLGTSANRSYFADINNRDGYVATYMKDGSCSHIDYYYFDEGIPFRDTLGATSFMYYVHAHMPDDTRYPLMGYWFDEDRVFRNYSLYWDNIAGALDFLEIFKNAYNTNWETYGGSFTVRNGIYIGLINMYNDTDSGKREMIPFLIYSRNGWNWSFVDITTPIIPLGSPGDFDDGMVNTWRTNIFIEDDPNTTTDRIYYGGYDGPHDPPPDLLNLGLINFRKNGFSYAEPTSSSGWLRTVTIPNEFKQNFIVNGNFSGSNKLNISVINASSGIVFPGFDFSDFATITTDSVSISPAWGSSTLADIPNYNFKLNFSFDGGDGELYYYSLEAQSVVEFISIDSYGNNSIVNSTTPIFEWTKVSGAIKYHLLIAEDSAFSSIVVNLSDINESNYPTEYDDTGTNVTFILPVAYTLDIQTVYYCKVRVYYEEG